MDEKVRIANCIAKLSVINYINSLSAGFMDVLAINDKIKIERRKLEKLASKEKADLYYNYLVKIAYENLYESNSSFILKKLREINTAIELDNNAAD
ncbi:hypothetical protein [Chryseobacterium indologenes]|uniref:hypothetical protein n=1 Tax=Chryseobacterium indologenes TaxID=253 RepID=UPI0009A14E52|nr:hypothetical protein [Chryseobacterium indologenes]